MATVELTAVDHQDQNMSDQRTRHERGPRPDRGHHSI